MADIKRALLLGCAGWMGVASPVLAQVVATAPAPEDEAAEQDGLIDIVVTARKREERLQDIPIAVTAVSSETLAAAGTVDIRDVAKIAPGLFYQSFDQAKPNLYIRGIGTRSYDAGAEASIGTFVDGVYIARFGAQVQDLADVERVEVLKGPQGALFGRNTIGGAINIVTKKPGNGFEGNVSATYGRLDRFDADMFSAAARIAGPVTNGVAAQLSVSHSDADGPAFLTNTGEHANGGGTTTARGRVVLTPAGGWEVDLIGDYFKSVDNTLVYRNNDIGGLRPRVYLAKPDLTVPIDPNPYKTTITPGFEGDSQREGFGLAGTITYGGASMELTSITAYRELDTAEVNDSDGTLLNIVSLSADEGSSQFSQEIRLASVDGGALTFGDRVDWLVGGYYFTESINRDDNLFVGPDSVLTLFSGGTTYTDRRNAMIKTHSFAVFGQVGIDITQQLKLDIGLRYSDERKRGTLVGISGGGVTIPANYTARPEGKFDSLDPSVALSYKPSDDVLLFVSYAKGFKGGAFQFLAGNQLLANQVVRPERLDAFQGGMKADLFNRRVRINVAAFRYNYKNLQVPRFAVPIGGTIPSLFLTNAAKSTIKGFEAEGTVLLSEAFRIEYGYAYLDAQYDDYVYNTAAAQDFSGNRLPRAPKHNLKLAANLDLPLGRGRFIARGSLNHSSSFFFEPDNDQIDVGGREPAYTTLDASIGWKTGPYQVTLWGKNLGDEQYRASIVNPGGTFRVLELWASGRSFGLTVAANW